MKKTIFTLLTVTMILSLLSGCGPSSKLPNSERREITRDMAKETLERFYKEEPAG